MLMNLGVIRVLVEHVGLLTLLFRLLLLSRLLLLILLRMELVLSIVFMFGCVHTWNSFHL